MSATVYATARFGIVAEVTATGLFLGTFTTDYTADIEYLKNHIGCDVGLSIYNDSSEISCDGVVATKATGLVPVLAATITLANDSADTLGTNKKNLFTTPVGSAGVIVTGATLTRTNSQFETGSVKAVYKPLVSTTSPSVIS